LWRRDLLDAKTPPREVVPSSRSQYDAQYSPDGKHIAFASRRSGVQEVWVSDEDGGNLVQVSDSNAPSGSPQWSPNGNDLAFDTLSQNRWEIYVSNLVERKPRKLNTNIPYIARPNWSRDGKWIYFVSLEPGREGLYRCPAQGGDAIQLSRDAVAFNPKESPDGKELYFANGHRDVTLRRLALPGQLGSESTVDPSLHIRDTQSWVLTSRGIYFVPAEAPRAVRFFDFATRRTRTVFESTRNLRTGLSISPDGRWILYSQEDELNGDVMIVDSPL
jgi:Tol biopolymer transport system component